VLAAIIQTLHELQPFKMINNIGTEL